MTMRFLDIDLDAFVEPTAYWPEGGRLEEAEYTAWSEDRLRAFLETQCGLTTAAPIDGDFVIEHDGAFDIIKRIHADAGQISLTHVDAHADLGMGDTSWVYMHTELMRQPITHRVEPLRGTSGMNLGSWLAFVAAAGWVSDVTFVHPEEGAKDLPPVYFRNCETSSRILELKRFHDADLSNGKPDYGRLLRAQPLQHDPGIPFQTVTLEGFKAAAPFERGLLCHSLDYTPLSADALIPVIREYIRF